MSFRSEKDVTRKIFETRYPDAQQRKIILEIFADTIQEVSRYNRDCWAMHMDGDIVRLLIGHYIVLTTWRRGMVGA